MKAVVIGVKADSPGIADYHVRGYKKAGCEVVAITGRNQDHAERAAARLRERFRGIKPNIYGSVDQMLETEQPDIVSVCSPTPLHKQNIERLIAYEKAAVLVEKPFVYVPGIDNVPETMRMIVSANNLDMRVSMNTQNVYLVEAARERGFAKNHPERVEVYIESIRLGLGTITDISPHANSMLIAVAGHGTAHNVEVRQTHKHLSASFDYQTDKGDTFVTYFFKTVFSEDKETRISVDGDVLKRIVRNNPYRTLIGIGNRVYKVNDPVDESVKRFVEGRSLVSPDGIIQNIGLQEALKKAFNKKSS